MLSRKRSFLPGLNGLRALAALTVASSHITFQNYNLPKFTYAQELAGFTVTIFFSLSGFLITYLLLTEREKREINVPKFYVRRILKIWPLYFFYFSISLIACFILNYDIQWANAFYYIFVIPNFIQVFFPFLYHYWSLGVEEQFYLIWPWIIKKSNSPVLSCVIFIALFFTVKLFARYIEYALNDDSFYSIVYSLRFDCMAIGAIGSILYFKKNSSFLFYSSHNIVQLICWAILGSIFFNRFHVLSIIDHEIISIVTVCLIMGQVHNQNVVLNLENKIFDFLGRISFGIYIYHPLVGFGTLKLFHDLKCQSILKYLIVYSANIGTTVAVAYLSYEILEKRFLQYKKKFE